METEGLLQCYNRGCGQKYNENENTDDLCVYHPGEPFFHDAYKGWSCCNKKCTDFTEFLNTKGCTVGKHSNIKPPEPTKPDVVHLSDEVIEVKPLVKSHIDRPQFDTPMTKLKAVVASSLLVQTESPAIICNENDKTKVDGVPIGTICKNSGCNTTYAGEESDLTDCVHHPGYPVFHEGLKFWTCCTKRTSDFNAFLNQAGCDVGKHVWIKEETNAESVNCRWDYHQTGTHVIVSIYAKQYCWNTSEVKLNPIRLYTNIIFPQQSNAAFSLDLELRGVIDVNSSTVNFFGTKVEIKLRKAEPGSWSNLDIPRKTSNVTKKVEPVITEENISSRVEAVDLSDL